MSLSKKQQQFALCISALIKHINLQGWACTFGDAYRDPRLHGEHGMVKNGAYGNPSSCHKLRLAVDLNLFVDGDYITDGNHPAYQAIGQYWESLDEDARWGGRFNDANHFSFEHWGCK